MKNSNVQVPVARMTLSIHRLDRVEERLVGYLEIRKKVDRKASYFIKDTPV